MKFLKIKEDKARRHLKEFDFSRYLFCRFPEVITCFVMTTALNSKNIIDKSTLGYLCLAVAITCLLVVFLVIARDIIFYIKVLKDMAM